MLKIFFYDKPSIRVRKDTLKILSSLQKSFSVKISDIVINIYDKRSDFNKRIGRKTPDWLVANASDDNEVDILSPLTMQKDSSHKRSEFTQILKHELTHLFVNKIAKRKTVPRWLNEGIACYFAKQNQNIKGKILIKKNFCKELGADKDWEKNIDYSAYRISFLFVSFLIKKYSLEKILKLLSSLDKKYNYPEFKKIFLRIYKTDLEKIEVKFIKEMNKRKFYIIPGWNETCRRKQYQSLAKKVRGAGFDVVFKNIDWNKNLSKQVFEVERNSILFGFSMGALLARLIAQENKCSLVILASMTPLRHLKGGEQEKILADVIGKKLLNDIKKNLKSKIKSPHILIYGDKENEKADILIKNTDHEISENYIDKIIEIIKNKR